MQYVIILLLIVLIVIGVMLSGGGGSGSGSGTGAGGGAGSPTTTSVAPSQAGGVVQIEIDGHRYFVAGSEVTLDSVKDLAKPAGDTSAGPRVRIKKRETSRATAEQALRDKLQAERISFVEE